MTKTNKISLIDRQITLVHKKLRRLELINPLSAESWQHAWDRHPDLRSRECSLWEQRGAAQHERDTKAANILKQSQRMAKNKRCPTCGKLAIVALVLATSMQAANAEYLGRLSANPYAADSTSNPYGRYGSPYSPDSINNPYGRYGSPYSNKSANNPYATDAPRIGSDGGLYGD